MAAEGDLGWWSWGDSNPPSTPTNLSRPAQEFSDWARFKVTRNGRD